MLNKQAEPAPLQGVRVLTCRPEALAARLVQPLQAAGAEVENWPLQAIVPITLSGAERQKLLNLDHYTKVVLVSPSAVQLFVELAEDYWPQWPLGVEWFTVGAGSAEFLARVGLEAQYPEQGDRSEDLLALPALQQLQGEKILLVKGEGGRTQLIEQLTEAGAQVEPLVLYQRQPLRWPAAEVARVKDFDYLVFTNGEALKVCPLEAEKSHLPLLVPSERITQLAFAQGWQRVINTQGAGAAAILQALCEAQTNQET